MLYDQIASNKRRTVLLLIAFFILLALVGYAAGYLWLESGVTGTLIALAIGGVYAAIMIVQSTTVIMSMNHATEVGVEDAPELYHIVEDMAMVARIPMPRVFIVEDVALNAFATGSSPKNAAVAATTGLLQAMNREELEAVMGHEISHIRNYDIRISTIAVALTSAITMISSFARESMWYGGRSRRRKNDDDDNNSQFEVILLVISLLAIVLAPMAAMLVQMAISRQREFLADASSVELTRNPYGMISALGKLDKSKPMSRQVDHASAALYINSPMRKSNLQKMFYTHPSIPERIERLEKM